ncbi:MAG: glutathione S-transferase family protein [Pseudomonadota bacterium]
MNSSTDSQSDELRALVAAANTEMRNGYANKIVGAMGNESPRFELYHSAPSLCSHKVRTTLAETNAAYFSHDMSIMPMGKFIPQNYRPEYVRLRLRGAPGAKFVSGYTGESSVTQQGFDPCVVPTLVDYHDSKVVVDSNAICRHIAESVKTGTDLLPEAMRSQVLAQVDIVDRAPHVAALYGAHPDEDRRPPGLRDRIAGVHTRKIRVLKTIMEAVGDDEELLAAYRSKIEKEAAAGEFVKTPDEMREAHRQMAMHVTELETQLDHSKGPWVLGKSYTLADITWTLSLWRMKWLGMGHLWEEGGEMPRVATYVATAFKRPSFRSAVVNWPGSHAPSPHVEEHNGPAAAGAFTLHMLRMTDWGKTLFGDPQYKLPSMDEFNRSSTSSAN